MPLPQDSRAPHRNQRWIECQNVDTIPLEFGDVVKVVDSIRPEKTLPLTPDGGRTVLQVKRATCDSEPNTVVIGHITIQPTKFGYCTNDFPTFAKVDPSVAAGDEVGLSSGSTILEKYNTGYLVLGDVDASEGTARVRRLDNSSKKYKIEATTCKLPGQAVTGLLLVHNGSGWVYTGDSVTADDPEKQSWLIPGERQEIFKPHPCSLAWEVRGEHRLSRRGKALADIACGSEGQFVLVNHTGTVQPPSQCSGSSTFVDNGDGLGWVVDQNNCSPGCKPKLPDILPSVVGQPINGTCEPSQPSGSTVCTGTATNCYFTACNGESGEEGRRMIYAGETVSVTAYEDKIVIESQPMNVLNQTAPVDDFCPDETQDFQTLTPIDYCHGVKSSMTAADIVDRNPYALAMLASQNALITNYAATDWGKADYAQVEHQCSHVLANVCENDDILSFHDCALHGMVWACVSLMTGKPAPEEKLQQQMYQRTLLRSIAKEGGCGANPTSGDDCPSLVPYYDTFCTFEEQAGQGTAGTAILQGEEVMVVKRVFKDGKSVMQTFVRICVLDVCETLDDIIFTGTEFACPTSSS